MVWNYEHGHLSLEARVTAGVWSAICFGLYIWQLVVGPILVVKHLTHWSVGEGLRPSPCTATPPVNSFCVYWCRVILFHALYFGFLALYEEPPDKHTPRRLDYWLGLATACLWQFSTFVLGGTIVIIFVTHSQVQGELTTDDGAVAATVITQIFLHVIPILPLAIIAHKPSPVPPILLSASIVLIVLLVYNTILAFMKSTVFDAYDINAAARPFAFYNATSGQYVLHSSSQSSANTIALACGMFTWLVMTFVVTESWFNGQFMH